MDLQCRSFSRHPSTRSEPFLKYLKPGALARLGDSRISGRSHRTSSIFQISLSSPTSNGDQPFSVAVDSFPCLLATRRAYGPRCLRRKKQFASKGMVFLNSTAPALDLPDRSVDLLSSE
ncbi:aconitate hydratase 2 [Hibiscus syriacus]|uniref:Aconitate hydratase 2 n=1 Tax=Hibiscus syriacus TaxID=106335 RepID=A0A6A2Z7G7_HIBSY|nr:aconitate hydratase 2 [Hibiscus syriacus]